MQELSDRTSHSASTSTSPSVKNKRELRADENATPNVVVVPNTRRRFSAQEKQELVRLTYLPGNFVSTAARTYDIAPSVLFRWRSLEKQGQLTALKTGEQTVSAAQYAQALEEIKRLQRPLGQATADNELLKEAVEIIKTKKWTAR